METAVAVPYQSFPLCLTEQKADLSPKAKVSRCQFRICLSLEPCAGDKHPSGLLAGHVEVLVNSEA
ncbi:MAG: hypothetical protein IIV23_02200, partial [Ruminococcus sp.]|nr:hypothetical protein [Ruminococcus sp.]